MLDRLAATGMEIAEACGREAKAAPTEAGLAFARVARAVRLTLALQSRLMKDLAALDRADDMDEMARKANSRIRLRRLVGQAAEANVLARADDAGWDEDAVENEIEHLTAEAWERLSDAEDDDLSGLSLSEAAAVICKDLGLSPDWTARLVATARSLASPIAVAMAGGGPSAEEPMVAGAGQAHDAQGRRPEPAPSTVPSHRVASRPGAPLAPQATPGGAGLGAGPPPAIADAMGEAAALLAAPPPAPP